jgi:hypothetical protein
MSEVLEKLPRKQGAFPGACTNELYQFYRIIFFIFLRISYLEENAIKNER